MRNMSTNDKKYNNSVKRTLVFPFAMKDALKEKYKSSIKKAKKSWNEIIHSFVFKEYKLASKTRKEIGLHITASNRQKEVMEKRRKLDQDILRFLERDENSRITTGIKQTITVRKVRKQKRLLNASLQDLHQRYVLETKAQISYSSFCRRRPFWIIAPKESDRETCVCKIHANTQFMADALAKRGIIETNKLHVLAEKIACNTENIACMYGNCLACKEINMSCFKENKHQKIDYNEEIRWLQWMTKKEERVIKEEKKSITVTVKEEIKGNGSDLTDTFCDQMVRFKVHTVNIWNQLTYYRKQRASLKENEGMIHIDFSENYQTKLGQEIQSMHFGGSHAQVTFHTGVAFNGNNSAVKYFCTLSDSMEHM